MCKIIGEFLFKIKILKIEFFWFECYLVEKWNVVCIFIMNFKCLFCVYFIFLNNIEMLFLWKINIYFNKIYGEMICF